jgi:hypothetical protein
MVIFIGIVQVWVCGYLYRYCIIGLYETVSASKASLNVLVNCCIVLPSTCFSFHVLQHNQPDITRILCYVQ